MKVDTASLSGVLIFRPTPHVDERGFFSRTFDVEIARSTGIDPAGFAQDSISRSHRGVIRGLHLRVGARVRRNWCAARPARSSTWS